MILRRVTAVAVAAAQCALLVAAMIPSTLRVAAAATVCATPGKDTATQIGSGSPTIVNLYYAGGASVGAGSTTVTLGAANASNPAGSIAVGDLLLIAQMQDASINSGNSSGYGDGATGSGTTALNGAGLYEYVTVTAVSGSTLTIAGPSGGLINSYTEAAATSTKGQSAFQIVRVPQYGTVKLNGTITAANWDGNSGGIVAIDVANSFDFNGKSIDVSGTGFRGGGYMQYTGDGTNTAQNTDYDQLSTIHAHGAKGEGIAGSPNFAYNGTTVVTTTGTEGYPGGAMARGAPGNAGGGGTDGDPSGSTTNANDQNTGGGGGANGGAGGGGGQAWNGAGTGVATGGLGGSALTPQSTRIWMGGGGGAGTNNNGTGSNGKGSAYGSSGGVGGGVILLRVGATTNHNGTLASNGSSGPTPENDGGGGGGAGGSVILTSPDVLAASVTANANGATGTNANAQASGAANDHGPGGGGGGGIVMYSQSLSTTSVNGGNAGLTADGTHYGATAGAAGQTAYLSDLSIPGIESGATCAEAGSTSWAIGPSGTPNASGSYDGNVPSSTDNDFTLVSIQRGVTPQNDANGNGVALSTTLSASTSPCVAHTFQVLSGGGHQWTAYATAPSGWNVTLYSNATCTTAFAGTTSGNTYTATTIGNVGSPSTITVYAQYTTSSAVTIVPFQAYDAVISVYQQGHPEQGTNRTHDELYFGYITVVKSVTQYKSDCSTLAGSGPWGCLGFSLTYKNVLSSAAIASETGAVYPTAGSISLSDTTPTNTTYYSASCGANPSGITGCSVSSHPAVGAAGAVTWSLTGSLAAGASGTLTLYAKLN